MNPTIKARIEKIKNGEEPKGYKRSKIGIVPNEWREYPLGELFLNRNETNCENLELLSITADRGVIPRAQIAEKDNSSEDKSKYKHVCVGDIGYNTMRMWQGVSALSQYEGIVSPAYTILKPTENVDAVYASFYFKYTPLVNLFYRNSQGLVDDTRNLKYEWFKIIKAVFPKRNEQRKIAEILATQDKVIELKEKLLKEKQRQKKYLMQQLLTGKKRLPGFSGEWKSNTVSEVCDNLDNYRKPFNRNERAVMKGIYPYYGANGIVDYIDKYIFDEEIILLAEDGGDFENYFEKPIAQRVMGKCWVNNHAHVLRVKQECSFNFVFYLLEHKDIRKYINGTTRSKLTKEDMQGIILNYPTDKKEQTAIAQILSTADKEIELLKKDIEQEKLKKKSLMQLLLTGIVRVNEVAI